MQRRFESLDTRELFATLSADVDSVEPTADAKPNPVINCWSDVACESLKAWCDKHGGEFIGLPGTEWGLCHDYEIAEIEQPERRLVWNTETTGELTTGDTATEADLAIEELVLSDEQISLEAEPVHISKYVWTSMDSSNDQELVGKLDASTSDQVFAELTKPNSQNRFISEVREIDTSEEQDDVVLRANVMLARSDGEDVGDNVEVMAPKHLDPVLGVDVH